VGVLDVAGAAERLERLRGAGDRLLAGGELGDRQQHPQRLALELGGDPRLLATEQLDRPEGQLQGGLVLHPQPRERGLVERVAEQVRAERDPPPGVVAGEREPAPQAAGRRHRVPQPGDREHRGDVAGAVGRRADEVGDGALERQLRGRHLAGAELVLQPQDPDAVERAGVVADLDVEHREPAAARPLPSGRASVSAMSAVTAEVNHFVPVRRHTDPSWTATVSERPTSDPPARSVIHCPEVHACCGSRLVSRGTARSISSRSPCASNVAAAPSVIASGQL
jgi:hypothetical protein